ncbi:putative Lytic polysaccharide mono-oxygenase, cellulose-degrading-containing protein 1 [Homarus americanus]|uniref:Putative Lytic polysaccharide mono-oxygenase, cellulose-degrading-containing protein 1 n=1 Tax=Homarus americanus TaxID=6706 RepID=A0A8J5N2Y8_HOMAM|nr:putative Lytic polysaccharide mono-oxygenase, cellulose-degrading-containing protein 1 [Homarus americanus]
MTVATDCTGVRVWSPWQDTHSAAATQLNNSLPSLLSSSSSSVSCGILYFMTMIVPLVLALVFVSQATAHLSLQEPPARNVMWRMGYNLPRHDDDDYLICHEQPGKGHCPPCGDSADTPSPHPHEGGGQWATGIISRHYTIGQEVDVHVNVTRSHGGSIVFKLCPHNNANKPVSQRCLDLHPLEVVSRSEQFKPQEIMFRNCADIAIHANAKTNLAGGPPVSFNAHRPHPPPPRFPVQVQHKFFG